MTALTILLAVTTLTAVTDNLLLRNRIRTITTPPPNPLDWLYDWATEDDDDIDWVAALDAYDAQHRHPAGGLDYLDIPTVEELRAIWDNKDDDTQ